MTTPEEAFTDDLRRENDQLRAEIARLKQIITDVSNARRQMNPTSPTPAGNPVRYYDFMAVETALIGAPADAVPWVTLTADHGTWPPLTQSVEAICDGMLILELGANLVNRFEMDSSYVWQWRLFSPPPVLKVTPQTKQEEELLNALEDAIYQGCMHENGELDSSALSSYAEGLLILEKYGRVTVKEHRGRRVIAVAIE